jgi:ribosomal protein S18 acetylase RimI-like enzyme
MSEMKMAKNSESPAQAQISISPAIRQAIEADVPFIFNSWLKSYRSMARTVSNPVYFEFHHKAIEALLQRSEVLVAVNPADANELYGYIVYEVVQDVPVIHYAYVKQSFRGLGIATALAAKLQVSGGGFYSHETRAGIEVLAHKGLKFVYNPYLAFGVL